MDGEVKVAINYARVADDSKWDGLKGYLANSTGKCKFIEIF